MPASGKPGPNGPAVTYIMRTGDTHYFKVGFTRGTVEQRCIELQCGCQWKLEVVRLLDGKEHERRLHREWSRYRMRGEWFELPEGAWLS